MSWLWKCPFRISLFGSFKKNSGCTCSIRAPKGNEGASVSCSTTCMLSCSITRLGGVSCSVLQNRLHLSCCYECSQAIKGADNVAYFKSQERLVALPSNPV